MRPLPLLLALTALSALAQNAPAPTSIRPAGPVGQVLLSSVGVEKIVADVRAADDARVVAMLAADRAGLEAAFSDQLHYAHSNGKVDTKVTFVTALAERTMVYATCDYVRREFLPVAPGIVLMTGRVRIQAGTASGTNLLDLNFLAVWREEGGKWRFLAWQSSRLPPPPPAAN